MGWLRDLMLSASPPLRSFGALSRALLGDKDWPAELGLKHRSLATVLSKLDRRVDLGWLADRPDVQLILARRLGCPVDSVRSNVEPSPAGAAERQLRLRDLRYARPFDLAEEPLPPGIPGEVVDPLGWRRLWWLAPHGSGRSLVGSWLHARGLARHVRGHERATLERALTSALPIFLELEAPVGVDVSRAQRICVAAAFAPEHASEWIIVESPPVRDVLPDVVDWVVKRMPTDSELDPSAALTWLRDAATKSGELGSLGAALGLCGALDELGARETRGRRMLEVAERFLRRRFEEAFSAPDTDSAWIRRNALDVLVGMARRALTDDDQPWAASRSQDGWLSLVPEQHRVGLEVEWLRVSLAKVDTSIRPADIERAARRMSPGAFRIIQALRRARLLVPDPNEDALVIAPHWLAEVVGSEARRSLLDGSPFEWGEGLLRPHAADELAEALLARFAAGDLEALANVVELEARDSPGYAAALETAFRSAGIALLEGADIDVELLEALFEAELELCLMHPDAIPLPRIEHPRPRSALLTRGAWHVAALAISERLEDVGRAESTLLAPWNESSPPPGLARALDSMAEAARAARGAGRRWGLRVYSLVERLRSAIGSADPTSPHPLELPSMILEEASHGVLEWGTLVRAKGDAAEALSELLWARAEPEALALTESLWRAWHDADAPDFVDTLLHPASVGAEKVWARLPRDWLVRALLRAGGAAGQIASALDDEAWRRVVAEKALGAQVDVVRALGRVVPSAWVEPWLETLDDGEVLATLWRRHPALVAERLTRWLREGRARDAVRLLEVAPGEHVTTALELLSQDEELDARMDLAQRRELARWLHRRIAARGPDFRAAYELFARLER